ncbi:MAG: hypothetical protein GY698_19805 [Actinomycetia bacterium]|nr:hypothetical protein [Actinomycetes bacterium]
MWLRNGASVSADVNGSGTPVTFSYTVPVDEQMDIERMLVFLQDSGSFDAAKYGNSITMTAGIEVEANAVDLLDGVDIKTNADWAAMCFDFAHLTMGTGDEAGSVRWTFGKTGVPLRLSAGEVFSITINDNLTGLVDHRFNIQGTVVPWPVYLGPDSGVTTSNGFACPSDPFEVFMQPDDTLYGVTADGSRVVSLFADETSHTYRNPNVARPTLMEP